MSEPTSAIVLACASDDAYVRHAAAMLLSAVINTPQREIRIHYLHGPDLTADTRTKLESALAPFAPRVSLHLLEVPDIWVENLPLFKTMQPGSLRPVMWYRLFLPQLLGEENKVLYLDCDTIVLRDLGELWDTSLDAKPLAAVTNPFHSHDTVGQSLPFNLGLPNLEHYFNSGVMLLNLDYFRKNDIAGKVLAHGRAHPELIRFGDQDSLCAVLSHDRVRLSPRWNLLRLIMMSSLSRDLFDSAELHAAIRTPAIVHFEGGTKPWINPSFHPYGRKYLKYAKRLPWPVTHTPWSGADLENFLIRQDWRRLRAKFRRLRQWLAARRSGHGIH